MWRSLSASINCTTRRTRLPDRRTLPSSTADTPSSCAIARMLWALARYCITDVREITFKFLDSGQGQ